MVYTPAFGGSVPIKIDGTAATVAGGVITDVRAVTAGETVAIPANGYVMVFGSDFTSTAWYREPAVGTSVTLTRTDRFRHQRLPHGGDHRHGQRRPTSG